MSTSESHQQTFNIASGFTRSGGLTLPVGCTLRAACLKIGPATADIATMPAHIYVQSEWVEDTTILNIHLVSGYIWNTLRTSNVPIDHNDSIYWHGALPMPVNVGTIKVLGAITNETGAERTAELSVVYDFG